MSDYVYLTSGDTITLSSDNGILATSSIDAEPGFINNTRHCSLDSINNVNDHDYNKRCFFRIVFSIQGPL